MRNSGEMEARSYNFLTNKMSVTTGRDEQFQKIAEKVAEFKLKRLPILSIDTKKKKFIGQFYRNGKSYCRQAVKVYENYHIQPL